MEQAKYQAFLDDYAFLIQGLLDSYEALFDAEYLTWAQKLLTIVNSKFWDEQNFGYYYISSDQEELFQRMKDEYDRSIPAGTGIMLMNNLRFFSLTEDIKYLEKAESIIKKYKSRMIDNPCQYASYFSGLDFFIQNCIGISGNGAGERIL